MAISFGIILILGLLVSKLFEKIRMPSLLGLLILGVVIGPYGMDLLQSDMMNASADFRKIALIIILLRAGLGINKDDLKRVGKPALKMAFIPGLIEGLFIALGSVKLLNFTFVQGGILGFIIAAVSPAVVVPSMLRLMEKNLGEKKGIPTLILASASIDDVVAITIFTAFLGIYSGSNVSLLGQILKIPISILAGIVTGLVVGLILVRIFKRYNIIDNKKVLLILGLSILLVELENIFKMKIEIATLLGVMTIGFIIAEKSPDIGKLISKKLNGIWIFAEMLLFVLVGAEVNIDLAIEAGKLGVIILVIGLIGRSIGVLISLVATDFNLKEKLFCIISYIPKATVQAAIGAIPLSLGVESGDLILAIAVLAILITAPLGAIGINFTAENLLRD